MYSSSHHNGFHYFLRLFIIQWLQVRPIFPIPTLDIEAGVYLGTTGESSLILTFGKLKVGQAKCPYEQASKSARNKSCIFSLPDHYFGL